VVRLVLEVHAQQLLLAADDAQLDGGAQAGSRLRWVRMPVSFSSFFELVPGSSSPTTPRKLACAPRVLTL
jgi:hypothetical protein